MAGKGGKRPGAGRPKGKASKLDARVRAKAAEDGLLPLEYMLRVMRDTRTKQPRRDDMAKAAAPYLHAKLSSVDVKGKLNHDIKQVSKNMNVTEAAEAYASSLKAKE